MNAPSRDVETSSDHRLRHTRAATFEIRHQSRFDSQTTFNQQSDVLESTNQQQSPNDLLSIVVPCYNEEAVFPALKERLVDLADNLQQELLCDTEIIFVDDGSSDLTWKMLQEATAEDRRIRVIRLSRNFGHQSALSCGYAFAAGDAIACLDADLQDPPELIPDMVQKWREGADVVYAVRLERDGESAFKLWTAKLFYRLVRSLGADHIRADVGDFRLMSRRSLDALLKLEEHHRFLRGMVGWIGFNTAEVTYHRRARVAGTTKYPLRKMVRLAADAIVSFSRAPLRLAYYCAITLSLPFLAYLTYVAIAVLFFSARLEPGWLSVVTAVVAFGVCILINQAILGEYVGRIYEESKQRPLYIVQDIASQENHGEPPAQRPS